MMAQTLALVIVLLNPVRGYFQPGQPVEVRIDQAALATAGEGALSLALLSPEGTVQATAQVPQGATSVDLAALFAGPAGNVWDGKPHFVQAARGEEALGAPLVVVPLSPPNLQTPRSPDALRVYVEQRVVLRTSLGEVTVKLDPVVAPNTTRAFMDLVRDGFYTMIKVHRVVPGFVIQAGDPRGDGTGGPGYFLDLEPSRKEHQRGTLSMARQGHDVNTNGSQFFICLTREACAALDSKYTAFGEVVSGMDVVDKIAATPLADPARGRPTTPPLIESAALTPAPPRPLPRAR